MMDTYALMKCRQHMKLANDYMERGEACEREYCYMEAAKCYKQAIDEYQTANTITRICNDERGVYTSQCLAKANSLYKQVSKRVDELLNNI